MILAAEVLGLFLGKAGGGGAWRESRLGRSAWHGLAGLSVAWRRVAELGALVVASGAEIAYQR